MWKLLHIHPKNTRFMSCGSYFYRKRPPLTTTYISLCTKEKCMDIKLKRIAPSTQL